MRLLYLVVTEVLKIHLKKPGSKNRRTIPSAALRGQGGFPVKKLFSIRKLQKMMILLFLVPMLLLQVIQSFYFLRVLSEEMAQNGREILSLHQNALDDDISRIADSISSY